MSVRRDTRRGLQSRIGWWIQAGANVAVFAAALAVLWVALHPRTDVGPPPIYAVGEKIDPIGNVDFRKTPMTLVMFLRQDCEYCRRSLQFYQRLTAAAQKADNQSLRLVVATTDEAQPMTSYLTTHGISVDEVANVESGALKIPGTPSLLLVNASGTVTKVWRGWLEPKKEQEVFSILALEVVPSSVSVMR
jgi:peroxiredoxin